MNFRNAIIAVLAFSGAAWWFLYEDAETRVQNAHDELIRLVAKAEGDPDTPSVFEIQALRGLFAESCEVSGDADVLVGRYSADSMVNRILQVKGLLRTIDLSFGDLSIEFPADDEAVTNFSAVLVGTSTIDGEEDVAETRAVTSRMRRVDGDWLFSAFDLRDQP